MPQLDIGCAEHPARVGKVGEGPDAESSHRQIVIFIHRNPGRKGQDRASARTHHRGRPRGESGRVRVFISDALCDPNQRARRRHFDLQFLLQVRARRRRFSQRREASRVAVLRNRDRSIVRIVGSLHFGGNPQAVAPIQSELRTAGLPCILLDFMEQILSIAKAIEENPRTDVSGYDQFDDAVGQFVRIVPASV